MEDLSTGVILAENPDTIDRSIFRIGRYFKIHPGTSAAIDSPWGSPIDLLAQVFALKIRQREMMQN